MKQFKIILLLTAVSFMFIAQSIIAQEHEGHKMEMKDSVSTKESAIDLSAVDKNEDGKVFECPMDWEVLSDDSGRCPKCEMNLKEYSVADAEKNLIEHGHKVKEHKMHDEHKMNMDKNHKNIESTIDVSAIDKNKDGKVFQCPMCSDQISDEAGKCQKCEMKLKENSIEDANNNLKQGGHKMGIVSPEKCGGSCCG